MKRTALVLAAFLALTAFVFAQPPTPPGVVHAVVQLEDGTPVPGAMVRLAGLRPNHPHQPPRMFLMHPTDSLGVAHFPEVPAGPCEITAMARQLGMAAARIEVIENQTTNVTLTLQERDSVHRPHDSLTVVELAGVVIVLHPDTLHPERTIYLLDVDADNVGDYRLAFGPPWYNPPSGAVRPANGDEITVVGGLLTQTEQPVVVVFEINGLFWRDPRRGHGGHGGGHHQGNGCNPDSITVVDLAGIAQVHTGQGWHGEVVRYAIDVDADQEPDFALDFGGPDYVPASGAVRPEDGAAITIVGGQIYCPNAPMPIVIVYEINGMLWREPGDTLAMGAVPTTAVGDPVYVGEPTSYLVARNFPNPFNPVTTISYSVPVSGKVELRVFDISGREVATLVNANQTTGSYAVSWDGSANASGIYFYRLTVGNMAYTNRMVLMK